MEFSEKRKNVTQSLQKGDINKIMNRSGLSRETVRASLKLESLLNATENQIKVWETAIELLMERQNNAKSVETKIARMAGTLQ